MKIFTIPNVSLLANWSERKIHLKYQLIFKLMKRRWLTLRRDNTNRVSLINCSTECSRCLSIIRCSLSKCDLSCCFRVTLSSVKYCVTFINPHLCQWDNTDLRHRFNRGRSDTCLYTDDTPC